MNRKSKAIEWTILNIGTLLVALGVYFFKFPNQFSTGGVSGISVLLAGIFPNLSAGTLVLIINMLLLLVGFLVFGKGFGLKTAYSSILMSLIIKVLEIIAPMDKPFTDEPLLELFFAVLLPGVGSAFLFYIDASTGGTDVIAMLLKRFSSVKNIGTCLFISDAVITVAACFIFGMKIGLLSILGLLVKSLVVDNIVESINTCKYFTIITDSPEPICEYIVHTLKRGATVYTGEGAFTKQEKHIILAVMTRSQAVQLNKFTRKNFPESFVMITNTSEIIGNGFRGF